MGLKISIERIIIERENTWILDIKKFVIEVIQKFSLEVKNIKVIIDQPKAVKHLA